MRIHCEGGHLSRHQSSVDRVPRGTPVVTLEHSPAVTRCVNDGRLIKIDGQSDHRSVASTGIGSDPADPSVCAFPDAADGVHPGVNSGGDLGVDSQGRHPIRQAGRSPVSTPVRAFECATGRCSVERCAALRINRHSAHTEARQSVAGGVPACSAIHTLEQAAAKISGIECGRRLRIDGQRADAGTGVEPLRR